MGVFAGCVATMSLNTVTVKSDSNKVCEFSPTLMILIAHFNFRPCVSNTNHLVSLSRAGK